MKSKVQSLKSKLSWENGRPARSSSSQMAFRFLMRAGLLLLTAVCGLLPSAQAQTIQFLNAAPSVYENGTNVSVVVTRTPASGVATVDYTTVDDSAVAGSDYQLTFGTLTFNDGESFQVITIPI